jgi:hypothetical protein
MAQIGQIVRVKRSPSREFHVNSEMVKKLPPASGLSQGSKDCASPVDLQRRCRLRLRMIQRTPEGAGCVTYSVLVAFKHTQRLRLT